MSGMASSQRLTGEAVSAFQTIYEEEFSLPIPIEQAEEMAFRLLELFEILTKVPESDTPVIPTAAR